MTTKDTTLERRPHKEVKTINIAKEESMATHKEFTTENPFLNYTGHVQEVWKEIYGYQVKTTQTLLDQAMKWGLTYTDHVYTQVNEASRLSQEYLKSGVHIAEEIRKNFSHMSEKITK